MGFEVVALWISTQRGRATSMMGRLLVEYRSNQACANWDKADNPSDFTLFPSDKAVEYQVHSTHKQESLNRLQVDSVQVGPL